MTECRVSIYGTQRKRQNAVPLVGGRVKVCESPTMTGTLATATHDIGQAFL